MRQQGAEVLYVTADVGNSEDVDSLIQQSKSHFGEIHGIIHAAGVSERLAYSETKTPEEMSAVLAPKVWGTRNLDEATKKRGFGLFS